MEALVPMLILPYYCVIGGWVSKYLAAFIFEPVEIIASDSYFSNFISSSTPPILWFLFFIMIIGAAVTVGVEKGIEKVSKT